MVWVKGDLGATAFNEETETALFLGAIRSSHTSVRMRFEVLPKKILAVVVAVRRSHDHVNMLASRNVLGAQVRGSHRALMVELDENDRTMNSVGKDRVVARRRRRTKRSCGGSPASPSDGTVNLSLRRQF